MKIKKERLVEIIKEEHDMMRHQEQPFVQNPDDDSEGKMAKSQLKNIAFYAMELHEMLEVYGDNVQLESWVQSKITLANDYISKVKHFLENETNMKIDVQSGSEDSVLKKEH